jgi:hypothetical protein
MYARELTPNVSFSALALRSLRLSGKDITDNCTAETQRTQSKRRDFKEPQLKYLKRCVNSLAYTRFARVL